MALVNLKDEEIQVVNIHYGPDRGGKASILDYLNFNFANRINPELATIEKSGNCTFFSESLPFDIEHTNGFNLKIEL